MATCVEAVSVQMEGSTLAVLTPSANTAQACATGMLLVDQAQYASLQQIPMNPLLLTPEDGALVGFAIVGVWAAAWVFKALILTLKNDGEALND